MRQRYGDHNWRLLMREPQTENGLAEALPRRTICGSPAATKIGLVPVQDSPDLLVDPADYKEVIAACHEKKLFPMYHQDATGLFEGSTQDSLGYCWAWSAVNALMAKRAIEGQKPVLLAPVTLGWLVNWKNQGNYLESAIQGLNERGVAPLSFVPNQHSTNYRQYKDGWEDAALDYRSMEWWDCNYTSERAMLQQCLTILSLAIPLYAAWDHLGHAMQIAGMLWDEKARNNTVYVIRNSHGEKDYIEMEGVRATPNEAYGLRAACLPRT